MQKGILSFLLTLFHYVCMSLTVAEFSFAQTPRAEDQPVPAVRVLVKPASRPGAPERRTERNLGQQNNPSQRRTVVSGNGGERGGGTIVKIEGRSLLLDLLVANPALEDLRSRDQGVELKATRWSELSGFQQFNIKSVQAYPQALRRLKLWEKSSPTIVPLVISALENMVWTFTTHRLSPVPVDYVLPDELLDEAPELSAAVIYTREFGAWLLATAWNDLGPLSQTGLLIHEALRHVQLFYGYELSAKEVQLLTSTIVLRSPEDAESLESSSYLSGQLLQLANSRRALSCMHQEYQRKLCSTLSGIFSGPTTYGTRLAEAINKACKGELQTDTKSQTELVHLLFAESVSAEHGDREAKILGRSGEDGRVVLMNFIVNGFELGTPAFMDAARNLARLDVTLGQKVVEQFLRGTGSGYSREDKFLLKKFVKTVKKMNKEFKSSGRFLY